MDRPKIKEIKEQATQTDRQGGSVFANWSPHISVSSYINLDHIHHVLWQIPEDENKCSAFSMLLNKSLIPQSLIKECVIYPVLPNGKRLKNLSHLLFRTPGMEPYSLDLANISAQVLLILFHVS